MFQGFLKLSNGKYQQDMCSMRHVTELFCATLFFFLYETWKFSLNIRRDVSLYQNYVKI